MKGFRFRKVDMLRHYLAITVLLVASPPLASAAFDPYHLGYEETPGRVSYDATDESYNADVAELFGKHAWFGRFHPHFGYRHELGDTIGRTGGLSSFDLFFPVLEDCNSEWLIFVDAQLLLDDQNNNLGSNLGVGARRYLPGWNQTLGAYVYHDTRDTGLASFQQVSGGFEILDDLFETRVNWYVPTGQTQSQWGEELVPGSTFRFVNHQLYTGAITRYYQNALLGADLETGVRVFTGYKTDLRAFGGCYFFQAQNSDAAWGWKSRVETRISDLVALNLSVQHDDIFQTTVNFAVSVQWPSLSGLRDGPAAGLVARDRLGETPERLRSIVVQNRSVEDPNGTPVINPATGNPYYFTHVATGGNSDGSYEDPYATLAKAFADPRTQQGDLIVYDHRDASEAGDFVLAQNTRVLSTGPAQYINTQFGQLQIPDSGSGLIPQITGSFTMHHNTEVTGFNLINGSGPAITANGVGNVLISQNTINSSYAGSAVYLNGLTGPVTFNQSPITATSGTAISIHNSSADVTFTNSTITGTGANAVDILNSSGTIQLGSITATGGTTAVNIDNSTAHITIDELNSTNASNSALAVNQLTGSLEIKQGTITNSGVAGVQLTDSTEITLRDLTINTPVSNATGTSITATGTSNLLVASSAINHAGAGTAVSLTDSSGTVTFEQTPITKDDGLAVSITGGNADIAFTDSDITNTDGEGIDIQNAGGSIQLGTITTTNGAVSANINGGDADITIAELNSDNASTSPLVINSQTGSFTLNGGTFTSIGTAGAQITDSSNVTIQGVTMQTPTTYGIYAQNVNGLNLNGNTIIDVSLDGIYVQNLTGTSSISGNTIRSLLSAFDNAIEVSTSGDASLDIDNNIISSILTIGSNGIDVTTGAGNSTINIRGNQITSVANGFGDAIHFTGNSTGTTNLTISGNTVENTLGIFGDAIDVRYNAGSATTSIVSNTIDSDDLLNLMNGGIYLNLNTTGATETFIDQNIVSDDALAGLLNDGIFVDIDRGTNDTIVHVTNNELGGSTDILDDGIQIRMGNSGVSNVAHVQVNDNQIYGLLNFGLNVIVANANTISMQVDGNDTSLLTTLNFLSGLGATTKIEDISNLSSNNSNAIVLLLGLGSYQNTTDWLLP